MNKFIDDLPTLSSVSISFDKIAKPSGITDRRYPADSLQTLIQRNQKTFNFLGITPHIVQNGFNFSLNLDTSEFVGCAPFFSYTGKPIFDINVCGRYDENIEPIIPLLNDYISPDFSADLRLVEASQQRPPIFLECCKYLEKYIEADRFHWRKFNNIIRKEREPRSSTLWDDYAIRAALNPTEFNTYHNKCNVISCDHKEWRQLNYVLKVVLDILSDTRTPNNVRLAVSEKTSALRLRLKLQKEEPTDNIHQRASDPKVIKELKIIANAILQFNNNERNAWRINYTEFFERYVQYIFDRIAKRKGIDCYRNPRYSVLGHGRPQWALSYIEPDLVLQYENQQCIVDAKYKSHMLNINGFSDELKDSFRHDFHQILAYTSFNTMSHKRAILVYPSTELFHHKIDITTPLLHTESSVLLIGIPIKKEKIEAIEEYLSMLVSMGNDSLSKT